VPVIQGTDLLSSAEDALVAANKIGYPVSRVYHRSVSLIM
jgi:urea carboxylase